MAATDYVVVYENVNGKIQTWAKRTTSDNVSTWKADGHLTVDGVKILEGTSTTASEITAAVVTLADEYTAEVAPGTHELDDLVTPTDMPEREDTTRDPYYPYEGGE